MRWQKVRWQTILSHIKSGKLRAIKLGKVYRIPKREFEIFVRDNLVNHDK